MDTLYMVFQQAMFFTIPLLLVALGGMFSERSGVINIALEGIMIMGAFTSILFISLTSGKISGQLQLILAILICSGNRSHILPFPCICSPQYEGGSDVSGTALNMFAPAFAIFVARRITGTSRSSSPTHSVLHPYRCLEIFR